MGLKRAIIGTLAVSAFSGLIGFGSAWFLQQQASRDRLREAEQQHEAADLQIAAERKQERTLALYGEWNSGEMVLWRVTVRDLLSRHSDQNYLALLALHEVSDEERYALDKVLRFYVRLDDLASNDLIDVNLAKGLLEPYVRSWESDVPRLIRGVDFDQPEAGTLYYAVRGLEQLGANVRPSGVDAVRPEESRSQGSQIASLDESEASSAQSNVGSQVTVTAREPEAPQCQSLQVYGFRSIGAVVDMWSTEGVYLGRLPKASVPHPEIALVCGVFARIRGSENYVVVRRHSLRFEDPSQTTTPSFDTRGARNASSSG